MSAKPKPFEEEIRFLRALAASPRSVGAIAPSGRALANAIAVQLDPSRPGDILELGPGTGSLTRGILNRGFAPERLTLVEYDKDMAAALAAKFAPVRVIHGDAFDLERTLASHRHEPFAAAVSGVPLLNFSPAKRRAMLDGFFRFAAPGAPLLQYSYGFHPPVPPSGDLTVRMSGFVWLNLPPARVWVYRKR